MCKHKQFESCHRTTLIIWHNTTSNNLTNDIPAIPSTDFHCMREEQPPLLTQIDTVTDSVNIKPEVNTLQVLSGAHS